MLHTQRTRIKICGVRDPETAIAAAEAGADAIGLVFVERSPRYVTVAAAKQIVRALPAFVEPVGLFVNAPTDSIRRTAEQVGLATVQLHGQEPPQQAVELSPLRVIKAMPFDPSQAASITAGWNAVAEHLAGWLWDAPIGERANRDELPGGTGRTFDWHGLAEHLREPTKADIPPDIPPAVLAGGLNPENVAEAIGIVRPWAVDVSSGVERERGVKDPQRIIEFCRQARVADGMG